MGPPSNVPPDKELRKICVSDDERRLLLRPYPPEIRERRSLPVYILEAATLRARHAAMFPGVLPEEYAEPAVNTNGVTKEPTTSTYDSNDMAYKIMKTTAPERHSSTATPAAPANQTTAAVPATPKDTTALLNALDSPAARKPLAPHLRNVPAHALARLPSKAPPQPPTPEPFTPHPTALRPAPAAANLPPRPTFLNHSPPPRAAANPAAANPAAANPAANQRTSLHALQHPLPPRPPLPNPAPPPRTPHHPTSRWPPQPARTREPAQPRTIHLHNLPPSATLATVTAACAATGRIDRIQLHAAQRRATVHFISASTARALYTRAENGLLVDGACILAELAAEIEILPSTRVQKIAQGATRVVRMVGFREGDLVQALVGLCAVRVQDDEEALQRIAGHFAGGVGQVEVCKMRVNSKGYNEAKVVFGSVEAACRAKAALVRCAQLEAANVGWGSDPCEPSKA